MVTAIVAVCLGVAPSVFETRPVNAETLLDRAYAASTAPIGAISSYHLRATRSMSPASGIMNQQSLEIWFSAPNRFRQTVRCGDCPLALTTDTISDGRASWSATSVAGHTFVLRSSSSSLDPQMIVPWQSGPSDLLRSVKAQSCGSASLSGEDRVAQRPVYVVKVTRQPLDRCGLSGTDLFWVDKETFVLLRAEQHQPQERVGQQLVDYSVSNVEYDVAIADSLYAYTPPSQATMLATPADLKSALAAALTP